MTPPGPDVDWAELRRAAADTARRAYAPYPATAGAPD